MLGVSVTTLRQHLPEYLARVARGERLAVTLRGRVIAEILPPTPQPDAAEAAMIDAHARRLEEAHQILVDALESVEKG